MTLRATNRSACDPAHKSGDHEQRRSQCPLLRHPGSRAHDAQMTPTAQGRPHDNGRGNRERGQGGMPRVTGAEDNGEHSSGYRRQGCLPWAGGRPRDHVARCRTHQSQEERERR